LRKQMIKEGEKAEEKLDTLYLNGKDKEKGLSYFGKMGKERKKGTTFNNREKGYEKWVRKRVKGGQKEDRNNKRVDDRKRELR